VSDSTSAKPKARLTAKGNVKVTMTKRHARLITALIGPTLGSLGYDLYGVLFDIVGDPHTFNKALEPLGLGTDEVPE
jgi:hypothetical protein